ncbi:hypothetical protein A3F27_00960 [Candidatus Kaiserbacteria bacterium RIFCSPHIGHO2_12_FULL_53_13]|uniref:Phosphoribosyltransferase domain-containing protein n=1 Tax=Candidatus Kaiserbacteria bacterium RIFCSPHIGHO2_12_FULL_53_13 TaxID=1798502 RepID=A0A1F6E6X2_9BACT|nr:MAG: hypothetical protein A3F27_00960 [Candidatus Kaiserbacteria bacterium RIFCSPHIGHO2_12_FULL_53_13]OGG74774.1 MAG: hypothetical protein A3A37_00020 [Candidatus Kaiserbacteria bacterium RIFCSPLOWO2_01_FULL_52_36]
MFKDRSDAGKQLAGKLMQYSAKDAVVLALPRGGVVTGYEVAKALKLPLDIVVVRKVGHPNNPEYAVCAVNEKGMRLCNEGEAAVIDMAWLTEETLRQKQEAQRRVELYRGNRKQAGVRGKTAIIVDDGVATGLSIRVATRATKAQKPGRIVIAVPVASSEAVRELRAEGADEVIVLEPPEEFLGAVGAHYLRFPQVEDDEVIKLLGSL